MEPKSARKLLQGMNNMTIWETSWKRWSE